MALASGDERAASAVPTGLRRIVPLHDPFLRRVAVAAVLTAAALGLAPLVSDFGLRAPDGARSLVWLALSLFGLIYLLVVAVSFGLMVLRSESH
jgi:hypothetical protein